MSVEEYLANSIASFDRDPADTQFQAGYLAALVDVWMWLENSKKEIDNN